MSECLSRISVVSVAVTFCLLASLVEGSPEKPTYLLFANRRDIRLVNADNPRLNVSVFHSHLEEAVAVDFYYEEETIFWTDIGLEVIRGLRLNGSTRNNVFNVITSGIMSPDGLACDWLTKKLYWADSDTNRIEVSQFDGKNRKVLFWDDLDQPRAIALVPQRGYMFWSDWGEVSKIERASMDGDLNSRKIVVNRNIFWPNGLTVDYPADRIYWADAKLEFIEAMDYDGGNRRTVVTGSLPHPFALTIHRDMLFWTDWSTHSINVCNKNNGQKRRTVIPSGLLPMDIHVYSAEKQPPHKTGCDDGNNGGCSNLCLLSSESLTGFTCGCQTGIRLLSDGKTCAQRSDKLLILARRVDIRRISLDTGDHTDVVLPFKGIKHAIAVDYDVEDERIYWTDDDARVIRRAFLNGTGQEDLITAEVHHPDGVAVDWIARNLYWTDTGTDRIEVSRLNGTWRKILITEGLDEPRTIALHPVAGYMFWTDWGANAKIEKAALDGTMRDVVIDNGLGWPNGLAIDFGTERIYWCDAKTDKIESSTFYGGDRKELISDQLPHAFGFTILDEFVYWTDWQQRSVERVNKHTGGQREIIIDQLPDLMGLKAVSNSADRGTNPCAKTNGYCSHLCLNKPGNRYVCACPMGFELASDSRDCVIPEAFLICSRRQDIKRISLVSRYADIIPLSGLESASAFDYDISDSRIYWADSKLKTISRSFMNGSNAERVVSTELDQPEGIAVDWIARNLYWTDYGLNRIEVSRIDGSSRKILIWQDLVNPYSLALNPGEGMMYWSIWGTNPRIERAAMDGSKRSIVVSKVHRASGLTVDFRDKRLFWIDTELRTLESSDFNGNHRSVIVGPHLPKPHSLTVYQDYVYWSDWETGSIERVFKSNGTNQIRIQDNLDFVVDVRVYHSSRQTGWNPCAGVGNGGCSHLCLAQPTSNQKGKRKCSCPPDLILSEDEKTCVNPPTCSPEQFACVSGKVNCIPEAWKCDGTSECDDKSDEQNCPECLAPFYRCPRNGACLAPSTLCDGHNDCPDGIDEQCCRLDEFLCGTPNKGCIQMFHVCDGKHDCKDGFDESADSCVKKAKRTSVSDPIEMTVSPPQAAQNFTWVFVIASVMFIMVIVLTLVFKKRAINYQDNDMGANDVLMGVTRPLTGQSERRSNAFTSKESTLGRRAPVGPGSSTAPVQRSSASDQPYDRNNVTGASSTSSSGVNYPKETKNPPPSPVTDQSQCHYDTSCSASYAPSRSSHQGASLYPSHSYSRRRPFRQNRPGPPPTPCSTDFNDDSDAYSYRNNYNYTNSQADLSYDSEPRPPPPTPRSHYLSDASVPPSPCTERSFYNPYVPPPSPVPESDD